MDLMLIVFTAPCGIFGFYFYALAERRSKGEIFKLYLAYSCFQEALTNLPPMQGVIQVGMLICKLS